MERLLLKVSKWQFESFPAIDYNLWNIALLHKVNLFTLSVHNTSDDIGLFKLKRPPLIVQLRRLMRPHSSVCAYQKCPMVDAIRIKFELFLLNYFLESHSNSDPVRCQFAYLKSEHLIVAIHVYLWLHKGRLVNAVAFRYHLCAVLDLDLVMTKSGWEVVKRDFPQILGVWSRFRNEFLALGQNVAHISQLNVD